MVVALVVLISATTTFETVSALPVYATHDDQHGLKFRRNGHSNIEQIKSYRTALMDPLTNYTDDDVIDDPTAFSNVTEYEFLQALSLEGIDSSQDVVESLSNTTYDEREIATHCIQTIKYMYYNCSDPLKSEQSFKEYKGRGYCPPRWWHRGWFSAHRRMNFRRFGFLFKIKSRSIIGYRFIRKIANDLCKNVHGRFLQQIVAQFALKGKKEIYQKAINRTVQRTRGRYKGSRYVIKSETCEKNGKVYVKFSFDEKHIGEAEH